MAILLTPPPELEAEARALAAAGDLDAACDLLDGAVRAALRPAPPDSTHAPVPPTDPAPTEEALLARWTAIAEETDRHLAARGIDPAAVDISRGAMYSGPRFERPDA